MLQPINKHNYERITRGPGDDQAGSFLALKRENDVNNAAFDIEFETRLSIPLGWRQHSQTNALIRALLSFVIWPLAETSTE